MAVDISDSRLALYTKLPGVRCLIHVGREGGPSRPSREVIAELEDCIVGDRVEVVFAIYKTGKPPLNRVEEWVKRSKGRVFRFHDELPLGAADAVICRGAAIGQSVGPSVRARTGDRLPRPRGWHSLRPWVSSWKRRAHSAFMPAPMRAGAIASSDACCTSIGFPVDADFHVFLQGARPPVSTARQLAQSSRRSLRQRLRLSRARLRELESRHRPMPHGRTLAPPSTRAAHRSSHWRALQARRAL